MSQRSPFPHSLHSEDTAQEQQLETEGVNGGYLSMPESSNLQGPHEMDKQIEETKSDRSYCLLSIPRETRLNLKNRHKIRGAKGTTMSLVSWMRCKIK